MEASLTVATHGLTRVHTADPLASILAGQLSAHTRRAYRHDVGHLLAFLRGGGALVWGELSREAKHLHIEQALEDPQALRQLLTVTRADLIAFRTHVREAGLSTLATNRRLAGVGSLLRELHLQGYRPDNPAERIRSLRTSGDYSPTRGLTADEARALLAAPDGDGLPDLRDRALLALMVRNGLRAAEVVGLRVGDLGEEQGFRVAAVHGKGGKLRQAKLAGPTWEALREWGNAAQRWALSGEAPLFVAVRRSGRGAEAVWVPAERPLTTRSLARIVQGRARQTLPVETAERLHPHALRHAFATLALEAGASLRRVQYAMGHSDPRTTERYDRARENLADNAADYVARALGA